jgi:TrkA domain protein
VTRIERYGLPGIGTSYTLRTDSGRLLGVVCWRNGDRELVFYADGDPERAERTTRLTPHEAQHLAELLHATIDHPDGVTIGVPPP